MHTLNDISAMKTNLVESLEYEMRCCGTDNMDVATTGQVVDMIKDLAKAEKDCMEACYYKKVIGAMDDYGFEDEFGIEAEGRMGYDNRRYASGRYAPKGRGHYSPVHSAGYTPMHHPMQSHMPMMDHGYEHDYYNHMGYSPRNNTNSSSSSNNSSRSSGSRMGYEMGPEGKYGQAYHDFDRSRRHYHESKDENEKMVMEHHADQYIHDVGETVRDIWKDATPEMKKRIKSDMSKLVAEMAV